jgi:hypothetical protein
MVFIFSVLIQIFTCGFISQLVKMHCDNECDPNKKYNELHENFVNGITRKNADYQSIAWNVAGIIINLIYIYGVLKPFAFGEFAARKFIKYFKLDQ